MGNILGKDRYALTREELESLEDTTFFTKGEIRKVYKLFGRLTAAEYQVSRKRSTVRRLSRSATKKLVTSPSQAGGDESRSATLTSTKGGGSPLKNAHLAPPAVPEDVSVEMLVDPEAAAALAKMEAAEALLSPEERERIQLQRAIAAGLDPDPRKRVLLPEQFTKLPQLVNNPFKDRIAKIYSKNEREAVGFEEFLDFLSVFSAEATRDVKAFYAFKIYDFDEDGYIGKPDTKAVIERIVHKKELDDTAIDAIVDKVFEEIDLDGDARLSFVEFQQLVSRLPNFENIFQIRMVL